MRKQGLKDHWMLWLIVITVFAIILRSIPSWFNAGWGADFGIYYGLTKSFVVTKHIFNSYNGWGGSYQFFPVLYIVTGLIHIFMGIDILWLLPKLAPIFGGFTVFIFYFIVYDLTKKHDIALLSSVFLSVASFHVFQTSHAAPLTIGHFFMLLTLYLYIQFTRDSNRFQMPLLFSTVFLIMSHHFTTYFFLISLTAILFFKAASINSLKKIKNDILYLLAASSMAFLYWYLVASTVFNGFMHVDGLQPWYVIILFYLMVLWGFIGVYLIKRYKPSLLSFLRDQNVNFKKSVKIGLVTILFLFLSEIVFSIVYFPGSNIRMNLYSILFSIPTIVFTGLSAMGVITVKSYKNSWFFRGWFIAVFCSFLVSFFSGNMLFYFYDRHIEYIMVPMSFFSAIALRGLFGKKIDMNIFGSVKKLKTPAKKWLPIAVILLICSNAITIYPAQDSFRLLDETISKPDIAACEWMKNNLNRNNTVIASDLKLCKLIWADGFNTTFEDTNLTWTTGNFSSCIFELNETVNHNRVTHILIDDIMFDKVVNLAPYHSVYMSNISYEKFRCSPFILVYRNATVDNDGLEVHWAEIYRINWSEVYKDGF